MAGGDGTGGGPRRRCIVTRRGGSRGELVRFAVSPGGEVVPDVAERLPGRGLWVGANADIVRRACAENAFARAARREVRVPADLPELLLEALDRQCMALVSLARRGGNAVAGFETVRAMARGGGAGVLIEASDGAADGREKVVRGAGTVRVVSLWTARELGAPFGRDRVVHAAIGRSGVCDRFVREAARLEALRGVSSGTGGECGKADGR